MGKESEKGFGQKIRDLRLAEGISLRKFAKQVGMSATYLSKVERGEFPPPAEDKVKAIAVALGQDADELLALAGRMSSDLGEIIRTRPREIATFLRAAKKSSEKDFRRWTREAEGKSQSS